MKGSVITIVLVFGVVFLILIGGLFAFILLQTRSTAQLHAWEQALHIAESGVEYRKWCYNNNLTNCLTNKDYKDINGEILGEFTLDGYSYSNCGEVFERTIYSNGWTDNFPNTIRKITAIYGRKSVAKFAYLLNDNVWAGADREIRGPYHSNGGVRMDGENQSIVSSALNNWLCTSSFGCSPDTTQPGVFTTTTNGDSGLFQFPVTPFDFTGITVDLANIKNKSQNSGVYLPPSTNIDANADGYHLIFNNDGTVDVYIITSLYADWAYSQEEGWHYDYFRINNEYFYNSYTVDNSCSALFVEDNLWIEGEVDKKVTIASADLINANNDTTIIIIDDIDYVLKDGTDGFSAIAQKNILLSPSSPDKLNLRGIFIAQKGRFGRNHYPNNIRSELELVGSVVSKGRVGTQWTSGGQIVSGYLSRENKIDNNLIYSPCPFVPYAEDNFSIINWQEVQ